MTKIWEIEDGAIGKVEFIQIASPPDIGIVDCDNINIGLKRIKIPR